MNTDDLGMNPLTRNQRAALTELNRLYAAADDFAIAKVKPELMGDFGLSESDWQLVVENSSYPNHLGN